MSEQRLGEDGAVLVKVPEQFTLCANAGKFGARLTRRPSYTSRNLEQDVVEVGILLAGRSRLFHEKAGNSRDVSDATPPINEVMLALSWEEAFHFAEVLHAACAQRNRA